MCKVLSPMSRIVFVFFCVHWLRMVYGHTTKREEGGIKTLICIKKEKEEYIGEKYMKEKIFL